MGVSTRSSRSPYTLRPPPVSGIIDRIDFELRARLSSPDRVPTSCLPRAWKTGEPDLVLSFAPVRSRSSTSVDRESARISFFPIKHPYRFGIGRVSLRAADGDAPSFDRSIARRRDRHLTKSFDSALPRRALPIALATPGRLVRPAIGKSPWNFLRRPDRAAHGRSAEPRTCAVRLPSRVCPSGRRGAGKMLPILEDRSKTESPRRSRSAIFPTLFSPGTYERPPPPPVVSRSVDRTRELLSARKSWESGRCRSGRVSRGAIIKKERDDGV